MNRWRTQWEEEMSEKNAVAAELLTLRSEFEKSSGTYDKEIEGLKDMLERRLCEALRGSWHWPLRLTTTPRRRQHGAVQAGGSLRGYACGIASSRSRFVWS